MFVEVVSTTLSIKRARAPPAVLEMYLFGSLKLLFKYCIQKQSGLLNKLYFFKKAFSWNLRLCKTILTNYVFAVACSHNELYCSNKAGQEWLNMGYLQTFESKKEFHNCSALVCGLFLMQGIKIQHSQYFQEIWFILNNHWKVYSLI